MNLRFPQTATRVTLTFVALCSIPQYHHLSKSYVTNHSFQQRMYEACKGGADVEARVFGEVLHNGDIDYSRLQHLKRVQDKQKPE